jgi:hypothetical protein
MKSSHSGTPIFSPADAVVAAGVDELVVLFELPAIVLLFSVVSVLLHPIRIAVHRTAKINRVLLTIGVLLKSSALKVEPITEKGLKSCDMIHEKAEIDSLTGRVISTHQYQRIDTGRL